MGRKRPKCKHGHLLPPGNGTGQRCQVCVAQRSRCRSGKHRWSAASKRAGYCVGCRRAGQRRRNRRHRDNYNARRRAAHRARRNRERMGALVVAAKGPRHYAVKKTWETRRQRYGPSGWSDAALAQMRDRGRRQRQRQAGMCPAMVHRMTAENTWTSPTNPAVVRCRACVRLAYHRSRRRSVRRKHFAPIIRRLRAAMLRWHPDRNPGDPLAKERFQQATERYLLALKESKR